jgi:hypothetical protein
MSTEIIRRLKMNDKIKQAALWMAEELKRTPNMAREKFGLDLTEMNQLYAEYARLRAKGRE